MRLRLPRASSETAVGSCEQLLPVFLNCVPWGLGEEFQRQEGLGTGQIFKKSSSSRSMRKIPPPCPYPMRVVYRGTSRTGREGQCCLGLISRADGDGLPCPGRLCHSTEASPRSRRSPGGPDLALRSHPSSLVLFPPYSLAWVFTMNFPLQLWWDMEAVFGHQGQDQDKGHGLDQRRGANQASSECAVPPVLTCVEMPMIISSHSSVLCSHLPHVYRPPCEPCTPLETDR